MQRSTAVRHLRLVAEACAEASQLRLWQDGGRPYIDEAWVFGPILDDPAGQLEHIQVVLVVDEPRLVWGSEPDRAAGWAAAWRLDRYPIWRVHRPRGRPVGNHAIRGAVRIWSAAEGIAEAVLDAIASSRIGDLERLPDPEPGDLDAQLAQELADAETTLAEVVDSYWEGDWRRRHRGGGRYPEHTLHEAAWAVLDLRRAREALAAEAAGAIPLRPRRH